MSQQTPNQPPADELIDAYLDDLLDASEARAYEQKVSQDNGLRDQVRLQQAIDESLGRLWPAGSADEALARIEQNLGWSGQANPVQDAAPRKLWSSYAMAASFILIVGLGAMLTVWYVANQPAEETKPVFVMKAWRPLAEVYQEQVQQGFKPGWVCKTDEEFANTFDQRFGHGLVLANVPVDVVALGLSYGKSISPDTVFLLARVEGQKVITFIDLAEKDSDQILPTDPGLRAFKRTVGPLVLYELTPLDQPHVLGLFKSSPSVAP